MTGYLTNQITIPKISFGHVDAPELQSGWLTCRRQQVPRLQNLHLTISNYMCILCNYMYVVSNYICTYELWVTQSAFDSCAWSIRRNLVLWLVDWLIGCLVAWLLGWGNEAPRHFPIPIPIPMYVVRIPTYVPISPMYNHVTHVVYAVGYKCHLFRSITNGSTRTIYRASPDFRKWKNLWLERLWLKLSIISTISSFQGVYEVGTYGMYEVDYHPIGVWIWMARVNALPSCRYTTYL